MKLWSSILTNRKDVVRILSSFFLIIGIVMSFRLWTKDRFFPLSPVSESIPQLTVGVSYFIISILLILLASGMIFRYKIIFWLILSTMLLLFFQDQLRWQPWAYMYVLLLVPFAFKVDKELILTYFQIVIIGVYLWGGIHKLSPEFIENTYNTIQIDMWGIENSDTRLKYGWFGYIIPLTEIAVAFLLFIPKTRLIGIIGAIISHLFIIIFLLMIDSNTILYPWNLAMMFLVFALFFKNKNSLKIWKNNTWQLKFLNLKALFLCILLPALSLFNLWDNYLSFKLYSGQTHLFYICVANEDFDKIDKNLHQYFWESDGLTSGKMISINNWTVDEFNVSFYPERRVFRQVAKSFCKTNTYNGIYIFAEFDRAFNEENIIRFYCEDLE